MGYADRVLQPGETIVYRANLHWVIYLSGYVLIAFAGVAALFAISVQDESERYGLFVVGGLTGVAGLFSLFGAWFRAINTEIIVSTRRIFYKTGFVSRKSIEMNLNKVESVLVNQGILGRLLDYGTLVIRGIGAGIEPVANVAAPLEFHRHVNAVE